MAVVSEPLKELASTNFKYTKGCTELYLEHKGIELLQGFEKLVNLEALWLGGNKLQSITGLDANFRIRALHVNDNQLCTLKGSLSRFKFLETLDLSGNKLCNLAKLLETLGKFQFLQMLNLVGNPCCEEPDYRLMVIHAVPSLRVLDLHQVTAAERKAAETALGGRGVLLTVAFGKRCPPHDPAWDAKVLQISVLEQELAVKAAKAKADMQAAAAAADMQQFAGVQPNVLTQHPLRLPPPPDGQTLTLSSGSNSAHQFQQPGHIGLSQDAYQPRDVLHYVTRVRSASGPSVQPSAAHPAARLSGTASISQLAHRTMKV